MGFCYTSHFPYDFRPILKYTRTNMIYKYDFFNENCWILLSQSNYSNLSKLSKAQIISDSVIRDLNYPVFFFLFLIRSSSWNIIPDSPGSYPIAVWISNAELNHSPINAWFCTTHSATSTSKIFNTYILVKLIYKIIPC